MKRATLLVLLLSTLAIAAAYASAFSPGGAPGWAAPLLALGTGGSLVSAMALGAERRGRIGKLAVPFAAVFVLVSGGLLLVLALPSADPAEPVLVLGLPLRAAILLYGIGLLPALIVPLAYALTFDELTLSEEDLERVREAAARRGHREGAGSAWEERATAGSAGEGEEPGPGSRDRDDAP